MTAGPARDRPPGEEFERRAVVILADARTGRVASVEVDATGRVDALSEAATTGWFSDVRALAGSPDGARVAVGGAAGVTVLEVQGWEVAWHDARATVEDLDWSPAGLLGVCADDLTFWDHEGGVIWRWARALLPGDGPMRRARRSHDGALIAISLNDEVLVARAGERPEVVDRVRLLAAVDDLEWRPGGAELAIAGLRGDDAQVWTCRWSSLAPGRSVAREDRLRLLRPLAVGMCLTEMPRCAVAWSPDGTSVAAALSSGAVVVGRDSGVVIVCSRSSEEEVGWSDPDGRWVTFSPDGAEVISSAREGWRSCAAASNGVDRWAQNDLSIRFWDHNAQATWIRGRLLSASREGLLVAWDDTRAHCATFAWGLPAQPEAWLATGTMHPGGGLACAVAADKVYVWSYARRRRPVTLLSLEASIVRARWEPQRAALRIRCSWSGADDCEVCWPDVAVGERDLPGAKADDDTRATDGGPRPGDARPEGVAFTRNTLALRWAGVADRTEVSLPWVEAILDAVVDAVGCVHVLVVSHPRARPCAPEAAP